MRVGEVIDFLERLAPPVLAESWDNVGLLVGDRDAPVERVMTCLTVTGQTVVEAIEQGVQLVVTHHPLPFRPLTRLTTDHTPGRLLWQLTNQSTAVASFHTAYDSAAHGINQQWAEALALTDVEPLREILGHASTSTSKVVGTGRFGLLSGPVALRELAGRVAALAGASACQVMRGAAEPVQRVAIACGSAGELVPEAARLGAQVMITGEASFHSCLEAQAQGMAMILVGHYASERLGVQQLAAQLGDEFLDLTVWASRLEHDPLEWVARER
jgi:dinuclear metal center YbgI/SA1388 family protein